MYVQKSNPFKKVKRTKAKGGGILGDKKIAGKEKRGIDPLKDDIKKGKEILKKTPYLKDVEFQSPIHIKTKGGK